MPPPFVDMNFKEVKFEVNDKTFKFVKDVSTETAVIVSLLMYKPLGVEFIMSRKMLIVINGHNKKETKHESVRIKRIVLDLHGVIVVSKRVVLFNHE